MLLRARPPVRTNAHAEPAASSDARSALQDACTPARVSYATEAEPAGVCALVPRACASRKWNRETERRERRGEESRGEEAQCSALDAEAASEKRRAGRRCGAKSAEAEACALDAGSIVAV